jgi:hypothetical protein
MMYAKDHKSFVDVLLNVPRMFLNAPLHTYGNLCSSFHKQLFIYLTFMFFFNSLHNLDLLSSFNIILSNSLNFNNL